MWVKCMIVSVIVSNVVVADVSSFCVIVIIAVTCTAIVVVTAVGISFLRKLIDRIRSKQRG